MILQNFDFFGSQTSFFSFVDEPITYANGSTLDDPAITYGIGAAVGTEVG